MARSIGVADLVSAAVSTDSNATDEPTGLPLIICPLCLKAPVLELTCKYGLHKGKKFFKCQFNDQGDPKSCRFYMFRGKYERLLATKKKEAEEVALSGVDETEKKEAEEAALSGIDGSEKEAKEAALSGIDASKKEAQEAGLSVVDGSVVQSNGAGASKLDAVCFDTGKALYLIRLGKCILFLSFVNMFLLLLVIVLVLRKLF
ncbi:hypothetical protein ACP4OV_031935 [Aristida adscensionis]